MAAALNLAGVLCFSPDFRIEKMHCYSFWNTHAETFEYGTQTVVFVSRTTFKAHQGAVVKSQKYAGRSGRVLRGRLALEGGK